jgi:hypothetical protein
MQLLPVVVVVVVVVVVRLKPSNVLLFNTASESWFDFFHSLSFRRTVITLLKLQDTSYNQSITKNITIEQWES